MKKNQLIQTVAAWFVTSFIIYLAPQVWRGGVVLGNDRLTAFVSAAVAGLILTLLTMVAMPLLDMAKVKSMPVQGAVYLVLDVAAVWVIARLALYTGVGISAWYVALVLGLLIWVAQYLVYLKLKV